MNDDAGGALERVAGEVGGMAGFEAFELVFVGTCKAPIGRSFGGPVGGFHFDIGVHHLGGSSC